MCIRDRYSEWLQNGLVHRRSSVRTVGCHVRGFNIQPLRRADVIGAIVLLPQCRLNACGAFFRKRPTVQAQSLCSNCQLQIVACNPRRVLLGYRVILFHQRWPPMGALFVFFRTRLHRSLRDSGQDLCQPHVFGDSDILCEWRHILQRFGIFPPIRQPPLLCAGGFSHFGLHVRSHLCGDNNAVIHCNRSVGCFYRFNA